MFQKYLVTGANGFLGRTVISELKKKNAEVRALVLENETLSEELKKGVTVVYGDILNEESLIRFFDGANDQTCVIHCAGIVSLETHPNERIYAVNVGGTNNVLRHCEKNGVGKLVYVSSVHAIPERFKEKEITENTVFSPSAVKGDYAKSKAIATALVSESVKRGLNASVVFPSGIIGPGDSGKGGITNMLLSFIKGKLHLAVKGAYDFVDVRDVAKGIADCAERGQKGRGYVLCGQYASIKNLLYVAKNTLKLKRCVLFLPVGFAKVIAPLYEKLSLKKNRPLYFTPYSVSVLCSDGNFSKHAAVADFGYSPRSVKSSVKDTVLWLKKRAELYSVPQKSHPRQRACGRKKGLSLRVPRPVSKGKPPCGS